MTCNREASSGPYSAWVAGTTRAVAAPQLMPDHGELGLEEQR